MGSNTKGDALLSGLVALRKRKSSIIQMLESGIDALTMETEQNLAAIKEKEAELEALRHKRDELAKRAAQYLSGTNRIAGGKESPTGRTRVDIRDKVLDNSDLRPTVSHRFQSGELVIGKLQTRVAKETNGKVWTRTSAELVDMLYKTDDGEGFYSASYKRGVKLNPLAIYRDKAKGRLLTS